MVETDCLVVVQAIRCPLNMISYIGGIVQDCKTTLSSLTDVLLVFIKRSANNVAHEIARASNIVPDRIFGGEISSKFQAVILNDMI